MTLSPGTRLGPYEILAPLGAGGMGEVYRARDTSLERDVAIKLLPDGFVAGPEHRARFDREAKLLAALNHPAIASIHAVEHHLDQPALVLELVEGETLEERLKRGPSSVPDALEIARQIAEALEAAHERGIIHRDLKPSNIKLTPEGRVKLLDFGLAKALRGDEVLSSSVSTAGPEEGETRSGTILGTAPYMSPEQARGEEADRRTDIWALGCVLYELLTGTRAFAGRTTADAIAAVLGREPDWERLPDATPRMVRSLLRRCLRKDKARRLHDVTDARLEIEESLSETHLPEATPSKASRAKPLWWRVATVALVATAVIVAAIALMRWKGTEPGPVTRFEITLPGQELAVEVMGPALALSPDGTHMVLVAQERSGERQLYLRALDQLDAVPMPGTRYGRVPFFSPDGRWVGFFAEGQLRKALVSGGAPTTVSAAGGGLGGTWGEDGTIAYVTGDQGGLVRVHADGGEPETILPPDSGLRLVLWPRFLPGSRGILFTYTGRAGERRVAVLSLETGEHRDLVAGVSGVYVPTGHLVFAREGSLFAVLLDPGSLELAGTPTLLLEGVRMTELGEAHFSISNSGTLAYLPSDPGGESQALLLVDRYGESRVLTEVSGACSTPRFSPDGRRIAVSMGPRFSESSDIWVLDLETSRLDRLTFTSRSARCPVWSPDGGRLAYFSAQGEKGGGGLFVKPSDGSGAETQLTRRPDSYHQLPGSWASHGNLLIFEQDDANGADIHSLSPDRTSAPQPLASTESVEEYGPRLSPDGRSLAYVSMETGRREVFVQRFPSGGGRWQVSSGGGDYPVWGPEGRELFFQNGSQLMSASVGPPPGFVLGKPRLLFERKDVVTVSGLIGFANYDVSPDGKTFVMVRKAAPATRIDVVLNWFEELKRRVPRD